MALVPRYYQQEAIDAVMDFLFNETGHCCVSAPTASGKSLLIAELAKLINNIAPDSTIIALCDVTALVGQNREELLEQWPDCNATLYSASYGKKDHSGEVVFCGIQSVYKKFDLFDNVSTIIIDEVHRASLKEGGMYHTFLSGIIRNNPFCRIVSLSATPWKMESGTIEGTWICDKIVYEIKMETLFAEGFLCPLVTPDVSVDLSFDDVKLKTSGEFNEDAMAALMDDNSVTEAALDDAMKYAQDRNSALIFACNVAHAENIQKALKKRGEVSEIIIGETETKDRNRIVSDFKGFKLKWLISVGTLTTGFNARNADLLIMLRATQSSSLWLQILGRVLRTHESKSNAMVLDYGKNVQRFGQIDKIGPPPTKEEKKQAKRTPFKMCGACQKLVGYLEKYCPFCDNEFGGDLTPNHGTQASTECVTEFKQQIREVTLSGVSFCRHTDKKGLDSMKVTYHNGLEKIDDYLYFEGEPYQRMTACRWWEKFADEQVS